MMSFSSKRMQKLRYSNNKKNEELFAVVLPGLPGLPLYVDFHLPEAVNRDNLRSSFELAQLVLPPLVLFNEHGFRKGQLHQWAIQQCKWILQWHQWQL